MGLSQALISPISGLKPAVRLALVSANVANAGRPAMSARPRTKSPPPPAPGQRALAAVSAARPYARKHCAENPAQLRHALVLAIANVYAWQ
jgi:hypothetical protein